ncbi:hypothetical protein CGH75_02680 [Vibrio parahaemolyticus]|nr:hypothetical protein CGH75_02680 [Vibrio parahaemolyticus]TOM64388.1 hypothetical protein CGH73_22370 [Vibrio parahaemolyticus]TOO89986.1 hypothetical protein CGH29_03740 [Vibrio parahaemolyticus]
MNRIHQELKNDLVRFSIKKNRTSKLDSFKYEILVLRQYGLSYQKISNWLLNEKSVRTSISNLAYMINHVWKNKSND